MYNITNGSLKCFLISWNKFSFLTKIQNRINWENQKENCTPFMQKNCQNTIFGSSRISFHFLNSIFQGSQFSFQFLNFCRVLGPLQKPLLPLNLKVIYHYNTAAKVQIIYGLKKRHMKLQNPKHLFLL